MRRAWVLGNDRLFAARLGVYLLYFYGVIG